MHIKLWQHIDRHTEDLDIIMSMYNLLEYSDNYSMTLGSLWKYCRDELDVGNDNSSEEK